MTLWSLAESKGHIHLSDTRNCVGADADAGRTSFHEMAKKSCRRRMRLRRTRRWNFAPWMPPTYIRGWRTISDCSVQFSRHPIRRRKLESYQPRFYHAVSSRHCYQQQVGECKTRTHEATANFEIMSARKWQLRERFIVKKILIEIFSAWIPGLVNT